MAGRLLAARLPAICEPVALRPGLYVPGLPFQLSDVYYTTTTAMLARDFLAFARLFLQLAQNGLKWLDNCILWHQNLHGIDGD